MKLKSVNKNLVLGALVILLMVLPLMINKDAEFEGADGAAEAMIAEINPDYEPWMGFMFEPPSGEVETLLFSLQAALGTAVIFYYIGYSKGKKKYADHR
ncbi:energy-coupling factor ABC transporter substrate-binding protein [Cellulosilyticum sp. I15G10I2]|uniref:energy-coupling factor ABC transporter substrate-binding protein n=1 Tax=Cellulosilyticum sp. I15G10I2 TaxID=1892843 RepID=UPI00085CA102|nr:energy-coupling factor ABC transporter substrate-binding protein [Cellulosilyticum sp. I15G10I2]